ncbi:acyl-CoA dehydrogenase family protein [Streptomyces sp. enrichment culture]|uniref:acyl-CoA dehydrogenase family protein n=1 Tax=Streptomyces sp. enrichment culture TaxID=1795815 RepID=UPI003F55BAB1
MDAAFTPEQDAVRRTLRNLLRGRSRPVREAVDTPAGHDGGLWAALAEELGLAGLALPESCGGVGCTATELALAAEETGRALTPTPLLATSVLAAPALLALGDGGQRARLLPPLAAGTLTATLAAPGPALATALGLTGDNRGPWAGGGRAGGVQARRAQGGWRLYGEAAQVLDGHTASLLLVPAHTGGYARSRTLLFLVPGEAAGLTRVRQTALDATRPRARLQLRDVEAELLGEDTEADVCGVLAGIGEAAAAYLACEAVGAAARALELTVEHVGRREQFGRPIGTFQALQHRLADVHVEVEAARSAAYYAAWAAGRAAPVGAFAAAHGGPAGAPAPAHGDPARAPASTHGTPAGTPATPRRAPADAPAHPRDHVGALALAQALQALRRAAAEAVQLHGGLGFTWEHDAHLYVKRAAGDELLFGPVHLLRARAAAEAGLFAGARAEVTV